MSYVPPDAAVFIERVAADPCCAAIIGEEGLDEALESRAPVVFILR